MSGLFDKLFRGLTNSSGEIADTSVKLALDNVHDALDAVRTVLMREQGVLAHSSSVPIKINLEYKYLVLSSPTSVVIESDPMLYGLDFYIINKSSAACQLVTPAESINVDPQSVVHFLYSKAGVIILN